ncbi:MAG TPA: regulatory protein RecX [Burkholderiaceae bacterium]
MTTMPIPRPPRSLKARALQWLAQRDQSRVELRRKLLRQARVDRAAVSAAQSGETVASAADLAADSVGDAEDRAEVLAAEVDAVLDWLEAHGYLSAERFIESRVHARAERYGNRRIRQELQQHQLDVSGELARSLQASEAERARAVRARRFAHPPRDAAERARQMRFLVGRGFSSDAVRAALRDPGLAGAAVDDDETPEGED